MLIYLVGLVFVKGLWKQLVSVSQYWDFSWEDSVAGELELSEGSFIHMTGSWHYRRLGLLAWPPRYLFFLSSLSFLRAWCLASNSKCPKRTNQAETVSSFMIWPQRSHCITSALKRDLPQIKDRQHRPHLSVGRVSKFHWNQAMCIGDIVGIFGKHISILWGIQIYHVSVLQYAMSLCSVLFSWSVPWSGCFSIFCRVCD